MEDAGTRIWRNSSPTGQARSRTSLSVIPRSLPLPTGRDASDAREHPPILYKQTSTISPGSDNRRHPQNGLPFTTRFGCASGTTTTAHRPRVRGTARVAAAWDRKVPGHHGSDQTPSPWRTRQGACPRWCHETGRSRRSPKMRRRRAQAGRRWMPSFVSCKRRRPKCARSPPDRAWGSACADPLVCIARRCLRRPSLRRKSPR